MPATRRRYVAARTEAKDLEAALLAATGKRWQVRYHRGTARGWFDVLPLRRDRRTVVENGVERLLRGAELERVRREAPWRLQASAAQLAVLRRVFWETYHPTTNVPGDEEWLTWMARGRVGPEPRKGFRDWD